MKKIALIILISSFVFSGCLKDTPPVDFGSLSPTVGFINAGLGYFNSDALTFSSDTLTVPMAINLASVNTLGKEITVTIGVDAAAFNTYNGTSAVKYIQMADSSYSLPVKTVTIPAGKRIDTLYATFYKHTFDPSKSYLLAVSITDASGITIQSNFQTHYFHVIGNPIAGTYEAYFSRWNGTDSSAGPGGAVAYLEPAGPVVFAPISPTAISVLGPDFGETDSIGFVNNAGVLSDFTVTFPAAAAAAAAAAAGVISIGPPVTILADPANGIYKIAYPYINGAGSARFCVNTYVKQ